MIDREQIESLLRIHGVSPTCPDEQIRSILLSANYNVDEIDTAITLLRESKVNNTSRIDGLHKVFRTDSGLTSSEISSLLGIDVKVDAITIRYNRKRALSTGQNFIMLGMVLLLTFGGFAYAMYTHKLGPFQTQAYSVEE